MLSKVILCLMHSVAATVAVLGIVTLVTLIPVALQLGLRIHLAVCFILLTATIFSIWINHGDANG